MFYGMAWDIIKDLKTMFSEKLLYQFDKNHKQNWCFVILRVQ